MKSTKEKCLLCSQNVDIPGFKLETKDGIKYFCCAGCLSVYRLLNPKKFLTPTNEKKK